MAASSHASTARLPKVLAEHQERRAVTLGDRSGFGSRDVSAIPGSTAAAVQRPVPARTQVDRLIGEVGVRDRTRLAVVAYKLGLVALARVA